MQSHLSASSASRFVLRFIWFSITSFHIAYLHMEDRTNCRQFIFLNRLGNVHRVCYGIIIIASSDAINHHFKYYSLWMCLFLLLFVIGSTTVWTVQWNNQPAIWTKRFACMSSRFSVTTIHWKWKLPSSVGVHAWHQARYIETGHGMDTWRCIHFGL